VSEVSRNLRVCVCDLDINLMTLKLIGDLDILKMYLYTENEAASLRHLKLRAGVKKIRRCLRVKNQGQNVKSSELFRAFERYRNRYSDKTQPFPTSIFWVAGYRIFAAVTLILEPWPWNWTVTWWFWKHVFVQTKNEVAISNHSKYIAWI